MRLLHIKPMVQLNCSSVRRLGTNTLKKYFSVFFYECSVLWWEFPLNLIKKEKGTDFQKGGNYQFDMYTYFCWLFTLTQSVLFKPFKLRFEADYITYSLCLFIHSSIYSYLFIFLKNINTKDNPVINIRSILKFKKINSEKVNY